MHKIILLLCAGSLMITSCNEKTNKIHAIFVDITGSTGISKKENAKKFCAYLKNMLDKKVKGGEKVVIYPIHTWTGSAGPIGEWEMPLPVDINWKSKRTAKIAEIVSEVNKKCFTHSRITATVRSRTSLFPIFTKLKWLSNRRNVEVTIFSDMIEDNVSLSFVELFGRIEKAAVKKLALKKYDEIREEISIAGTSITILYPRTEVGGPNDAIIPKVEIFWETFIGEAGANLFIADLS